MSATPGRNRKRWGWRRIHKWVAGAAGVLLTVWTVSGLVMVIPGGGAPEFRHVEPEVDLRAATVSPAAAIEALESRGLDTDGISNAAFRTLGSRPVWVVQVPGRGSALVDATTGESFEIDEGEALRTVREQYGGEGRPRDPELVTARSLGYFIGPLPAWRIVFADEHGTEAYVGVRNGTVIWWDGRSRTRRLMAAAHDWWPLGLLFGQLPRLGLMYLGGLLVLIATATGYWLALRRKRGRA